MLRKAKETLALSGIDNPAREAEIILSFCLGADRAVLYRDNPQISLKDSSRIKEFVERRSSREPMQYILGVTEFYGLKIQVGPGVLVPRPETEILAGEAIKVISAFDARMRDCTVLDLCTGTGCLAIAIAKQFPEARIYGTDISVRAMNYARANAELNRTGNIIFLQGSLFDPVKKDLRFNLIISNPPYIKRDDINKLQPEIRNHEPLEALDGGEDGLSYYRTIIPSSPAYLKRDGILMLEIGFGQADEINKMGKTAGFARTSLMKDYSGIERIFIAEKE